MKTVQKSNQSPAATSREPQINEKAADTTGAIVSSGPGASTGGPLTEGEKEALAELEGIVAKGYDAFIEVGRALQGIQKGSLYRGTHKTFEEYVEARFDMSRSHAYHHINAAATVQRLSTNGQQTELPANERQVRPLARLKDAEQQRKAWQRACELAGGKKVTGELVEKAVSEMSTSPAPSKDWKKAQSKALKKASFDQEVDQPLTMGGEGVDFWDEKNQRRIKLVDKFSLETVAYCLALKEHDDKALVLLNGNRLKKTEIDIDKGNVVSGLCDPVLAVLVHKMGALVEYKGAIYEPGVLDKDLRLPLTSAKDEAVVALQVGLAVKTEKKGKKK